MRIFNIKTAAAEDGDKLNEKKLVRDRGNIPEDLTQEQLDGHREGEEEEMTEKQLEKVRKGASDSLPEGRLNNEKSSFDLSSFSKSGKSVKVICSWGSTKFPDSKS